MSDDRYSTNFINTTVNKKQAYRPKKMSADDEGNCAAKKIKLDVEQEDSLPTDDFFLDFSVVKILSENAKQKCLFLHGRFGDNPDDAVLLLEKTPFCPSSISDMLQNKVTAKVSMKNDIYKTLELCPTDPYNGKKWQNCAVAG